MTATWYLVKYVQDVFRDEPRNVGVVVLNSADAAARFVGEQDGRFDRRSVKNIVASTETFAAWRDYILHHLYSGSFESVVESQGRRPLDSYRVQRRGVIDPPEGADFQIIADELFDEVVTARTSEPVPLQRVVNNLLDHLVLPDGKFIERDVALPVEIRGEHHELLFDYRYIDRATSLMERVSLAGSSGQVTSRVHDAIFRFENVEDIVPQASNLVLYDRGKSGLSSEAERQLKLLNKFAYTVDARAGRSAAIDVAEMLGVSVGV